MSISIILRICLQTTPSVPKWRPEAVLTLNPEEYISLVNFPNTIFRISTPRRARIFST
ncbi:hypothetical protein EVA_16233 [gut metagenome]|uniref:Uncharacterized protein n=1 Tax=gut metagenome TaxID=749906 RepID=J9FL89_9ZZZZ